MLENDKQLINFIKEKSKDIAKKLKLKSPEIEIDKYYNNCSSIDGKNKILFGLMWIKQMKRKDFQIEVVPSDSFLNRIYFIIAHEIGHILQFTRHRKWFKKYKRILSTNLGNYEYANQKLEKNASKIANILLKEYKNKKVEKC